MAIPYRNVGSIESTDALASTTGDGAYMDYDSASGYARFGAKGGVGTSLGTKIRTVLAGVIKDALTIAASGLTITLLAGSTLAAQAVTATTVVSSDTTDSASSTTGAMKTAGGLGVAKTLSVGGGVVATGRIDANGGVRVTTNVAVDAAGGFTYNTVDGVRTWGKNGTTYAWTVLNDAGSYVMRVPISTQNVQMQGTLTVATGLTVSAGGIAVSAGASSFQNVSVGGGSIASEPLSVHVSTNLNLYVYNNSGLTIQSANDAFNANAPMFLAASSFEFRAGSVQLDGAFGCNGNGPQTKAASGGTLAGVIAALVANGILSS